MCFRELYYYRRKRTPRNTRYLGSGYVDVKRRRGWIELSGIVAGS
jgi:hypothetical protein